MISGIHVAQMPGVRLWRQAARLTDDRPRQGEVGHDARLLTVAERTGGSTTERVWEVDGSAW